MLQLDMHARLHTAVDAYCAACCAAWPLPAHVATHACARGVAGVLQLQKLGCSVDELMCVLLWRFLSGVLGT